MAHQEVQPANECKQCYHRRRYSADRKVVELLHSAQALGQSRVHSRPRRQREQVIRVEMYRKYGTTPLDYILSHR